jgi:hypothetical protein
MTSKITTFATTTVAIVTALALLTLIVPQVLQTAEAAPKPKVPICHVPEDAPQNATSKNLPLPAAEAHLKNHEGDFIGICPPTIPEV